MHGEVVQLDVEPGLAQRRFDLLSRTFRLGADREARLTCDRNLIHTEIRDGQILPITALGLIHEAKISLTHTVLSMSHMP